LILNAGCGKQIRLKATIQLHCIRVKGKRSSAVQRVRGSGFRGSGVQGSAPPPAKKTAGQIEKETNSSPQSSQRTLRKKILNNLCALRVLCGKMLLENGIGFHEVSYKRFRVQPRRWSRSRQSNRQGNTKKANIE
jgi:hypothetical protein